MAANIWLDELIGLATLVVDGEALPRQTVTEFIEGAGISLVATNDPSGKRTLIEIVSEAVSLTAPEAITDDHKMVFAQVGDLAYSAEFLHEPNTHVTQLNHASSQFRFGANPTTAGRLAFSRGDSFCWLNNAENSTLNGIGTGAGGGHDIIEFGGGTLGPGTNGFGITRFYCNNDGVGGGLFEWYTPAKTLTFDGANLNWLDNASRGRLLYRGITVIEYTGDGSGFANLSIFGVNPSFQSGQGVVFVKEAVAVPTGNPATGHYLYVESGALKGRGTSGTITTIAPAEPHCPRCGRDFAVEHSNPAMGHLAICLWCLTTALEGAGIPGSSFLIKREDSCNGSQ
jgi:hypothetical protein